MKHKKKDNTLEAVQYSLGDYQFGPVKEPTIEEVKQVFGGDNPDLNNLYPFHTLNEVRRYMEMNPLYEPIMGNIVSSPNPEPPAPLFVSDYRSIEGALLPDSWFNYERGVLYHLDDNVSTWIQREQHGEAPHSFAEANWREEYRKPKPIKWEMMQILEHKCWRCQHWEEKDSVVYSNSKYYRCKYNSNHIYSMLSDEFPTKPYWIKIPESEIILNNKIYYSSEPEGEYFDLVNCHVIRNPKSITTGKNSKLF